MNELKLKLEGDKSVESTTDMSKPKDKLPWETPKLEDVSEQVMAQPYIRFT
jgi:hypothetical protein